MSKSSIIILKGPDRVRKRPCVIFGANGIEGATEAIKMLLNIFITEAASGFSSRIDLTIHKDNSISIRSYDRGFALDETIINGKPAWYLDFCEIFAAPREPNENYYFPLEHNDNTLYGKQDNYSPIYKRNVNHSFDLCCVQYASKFMHVEATRDGIKKILDFKDGYSVSDLIKENTEETNNTFIHFLLEADVFGVDIDIPENVICEFLKDIAIAIPGIRCEISDERSDYVFVYHYPDGAQSYISEITENTKESFVNHICAQGKDRYNRCEYNAEAKATIYFDESRGFTLCLHNLKKLEYGGCHLDAIKEQLIKTINQEFIYDSNNKLSFEDIQNNIILILETNCDENASNYLNATKKSLNNKMITDMASDLINPDFQHYLNQNHNTISTILKKIRDKKQI